MEEEFVMKRFTKRFQLLTLLLISGVLLLAACSSKDDSDAVEKVDVKDEEEFLVEMFDEINSGDFDVVELEKDVEARIESLSEEAATEAVDGLLYARYQGIVELEEKVAEIQEELLKYDDLDLSNDEFIEKIEDEKAKEVLSEIYEQGYVLFEQSDYFFVHPNITSLIERFGDHVSEDLLAMMKFSEEELRKPFFIVEESFFDMDRLVELILILEENSEKYADDHYGDSFKTSLNYYLQLYYGVNNGFIVQEDKFVDEAVEHYKEVAKKYKKTTFGKNTQELLDMLEESNNEMTDDVLNFLIEITDGVSEYSLESETEGSEYQTYEDALNDALEEEGDRGTEK